MPTPNHDVLDKMTEIAVPDAKFARVRSSNHLCEKMARILVGDSNEEDKKLAQAFVDVSDAIHQAMEDGKYRAVVEIASPHEAENIDLLTLVEYLSHNGYDAMNYPYGTIDVKW